MARPRRDHARLLDAALLALDDGIQPLSLTSPRDGSAAAIHEARQRLYAPPHRNP